MDHFQVLAETYPSDQTGNDTKISNSIQPTDIPIFPSESEHSCCNNSFCFPATGDVGISMTNDYLFRALLQMNNSVLKGLISALLHLAPSDISSAIIVNPIELGNTVDHKTFILDIKVFMNNNSILDLEMQVINEHNWVDRSLNYLCRSFDHLSAGEDYQNARSVIQIGLLNFTLFPEHPEFYATYKFLNVKNYTLYSDKLRLSVLDLTHINLATAEDKLYQLDHWASLFKAVSWKEITMLAKKNTYINEAANTIYQLTQDEKIRMQCEAREDYYRTQRGWQRILEENSNALKEKDIILNEKETVIQGLKNTVTRHETTIAEQKSAMEAAHFEHEKLLAWAKAHGYEQ